MIRVRAPLSISTAIAASLLAASPALANSDASFRKIAETEYHWRKLQEGPDQDSGNAAAASLPDVGPKAQAEKLARWETVEKELQQIRPADLSPAEGTNNLVYTTQIDAQLTAQRFRDYEKPLNSGTRASGARSPGSPAAISATSAPIATTSPS